MAPRRTEAVKNESLTRRDILRASALGVSASALGLWPPLTSEAATKAAATSPVRIATPFLDSAALATGRPDTPTFTALSGLVTEHLAGIDSQFRLTPQLATAWKSDETATVWTFTIRPNMKFHDGSACNADAIVAWFRGLLDIGSGGQLMGVVSSTGITAVPGNAVRFALDLPFGLFPYLVSSDNPASGVISTRGGSGSGRIVSGTGPWVVDAITSPTELALRANGAYWAKRTGASAGSIRALAEPDMVAGLAAGTVDVAAMLSPTGYRQAAAIKGIVAGRTGSTAHAQIHLRTDAGAFKNRNVRRALQLVIDRQAMIKATRDGLADLATENPMAPFLPFGAAVSRTGTSRPDARQLMRDAKLGNGFDAVIASSNGPLSAAIAGALITAGTSIGIRLTHAPDSQYQNSSWLNSDVGITEFSHRATPAVLLAATLGSDGAWNASHYTSTDVDIFVRTLLTSRDTATLKKAADGVGDVIRRDLPIIVPMFLPRLWAARATLPGVRVSPHSQVTGV